MSVSQELLSRKILRCTERAPKENMSILRVYPIIHDRKFFWSFGAWHWSLQTGVIPSTLFNSTYPILMIDPFRCILRWLRTGLDADSMEQRHGGEREERVIDLLGGATCF